MAKKQQPAKQSKPATEATAPAAPAVEETSEALVTEANASTAPAAPEPTADAPDAAPVTTDAPPTEAQATTPPASADEPTTQSDPSAAPAGTVPPAALDPAASDAAPPTPAEELPALAQALSDDGSFAAESAPQAERLNEEAAQVVFSEAALPIQLDPGDVLTLKITPPKPTIDSVLRNLARGTRAPGYASNSPHCVLSGPQAVLQAKIYTVLTDQGLQLPEQGYVYGWLLDQILASLNEAEAAARG